MFDRFSIPFKNIMPYMHDRTCDKIPIPYLSVEEPKFNLGVLPWDELIVFHVPNIIHSAKVILKEVSNVTIGEPMSIELDVHWTTNTRM